MDIHRTGHGIVHVEADSEHALAYGLAHAYASDNLCLLADFIVSVNGERSRYFGPEGRTTVGFEESDNLSSDLFFSYYIDETKLREAYRSAARPVLDLIRGFAAGYNAYLTDTPPAQRPLACRDAAWVRPMTEMDMFRMLEERAILDSGTSLYTAILAAGPPEHEPRQAFAQPARVGHIMDQERRAASFGSNGWAFGAEAAEEGSALLFGNPHFPWDTINRFYQIHLRLRGEFDVMGVMLPPFPVVAIGFNRDIAWTHTVSTARRYTLFELTLVPGDPRSYVLDGVRHRIVEKVVRVAVREPDGRLGERTHTFYESVHGPIVALPDMPWSTQRAYAVADVNRLNTDMIATWLGIARARDVGDIRESLAATRGLGWINTIAADRAGEVLYADISRVPNVSSELLERCHPQSRDASLSGTILLDGARKSCQWYEQPGGAWLPASELPVVARRDYVANSNDSYWLVNARMRSPERSPILGPAAVAQRLRTRSGLEEIENQLRGKRSQESNAGGNRERGGAGTRNGGNDDGPVDEPVDRRAVRRSDGRISADEIAAILFSNRNFAGELVAQDLLELCRAETGANAAVGARVSDDGANAIVGSRVSDDDANDVVGSRASGDGANAAASSRISDEGVAVRDAENAQARAFAADLKSACEAIAAWDRRNELDSRGAALFREFWRNVRSIEKLHRVSFDPADPIRTPSGLNLADARVRQAVRKELAAAAAALRTHGFRPDVRLGDVQAVVRNGRRIEIHGGDWYEGVLNQNMVRPLDSAGYVPFDGTSYVQIVQLGGEEPVVQGLLTYSQSTDPQSPYYADQTPLYSREQLYRLPYTDRQIRADPQHRHVQLKLNSTPLSQEERP